MEAHERLRLLADASRYDVSCACNAKHGTDHRRRAPDGTWLYPASLPGGGTSLLLKLLLSSACVNDCRYCPFRRDRDGPRYTLTSEEAVAVALPYLRRPDVRGLFLSSGVVGGPDATMERIVAVAEILRRRCGYDGFLHLKVIPGASDAAITAALSLANCVSVNVEAPTRSALRALTSSKDLDRDIVRPMRLISRLTARGGPHEGVCQMTQFVVGAAGERDADIIRATHRLYSRLRVRRAYFSAFQRGLGDPGLPGEQANVPPHDVLTREHRLYQADWLMRKYRFTDAEIPLEADGNLSLQVDPKEAWARQHPERFPVDVNRAGRWVLLRVPGLGPVTVRRILELRGRGERIASIEEIGKPCARLRKAEAYIQFGYAASSKPPAPAAVP